MTEHSRKDNRILVVDDEIVVVSLVRDALEEEGYDVETASNGKEALSLIKSTPFDLIISDIRMPKMDGIELIGRARKEQPNVSVIFMTAFANLDSAKDAIKQGAVDYIMKPFELHEIRQAVEKAMELRRLADAKNSDTQLEHLSDLNQVLYTAGDKRSLLIESLRFALLHCHVDRGVVIHWDPDHTEFHLISIVGETVADRHITDNEMNLCADRFSIENFSEPSLTDGIGQHPLFQMRDDCPAAAESLTDWLTDGDQIATVPVSRANQLYGLMIIPLSSNSSTSTGASLKFLALSATQLAMSLENLDLLEEAQNAYTSLKELQDETIQLEKMATKGEMSAEIGHELNNFLGVVAGNLSLLEFQLEKQNETGLDKYVHAIKDNVEKIKTFTSNLMDLRSISTTKEIISFDKLLNEVVDYLKPQKRFRGVVINLHPIPQGIPFEADTTHIQQLLYNLFNNAADAMVDSSKKTIDVWVELGNSDFSMRISDTGSGIPQELLNKLFLERFTTKKTGHGYGLVVCKRIIDNHGGILQVESTPDVGTTITISFPLASEETAQHDEPALTS